MGRYQRIVKYRKEYDTWARVIDILQSGDSFMVPVILPTQGDRNGGYAGTPVPRTYWLLSGDRLYMVYVKRSSIRI